MVTRFTSNTAQSSQSAVTANKVKSDNVVHIDKYERNVEKQVNGPDKVIITKKTETVVDSIDNNKVVPINRSTQMGSSTSYGAGQGGGNKGGSGSNYNEARIKVLKKKKSEGKLTQAEKEELISREPNSGSIFD